MTTPNNNNDKPTKNTKNLASTLQVDSQGRRLSLAPTSLAQYLGLDSCDRFLRFYLYKGQTDVLAKQLRERGLQLALQPFGPLLAELGDRIETQVLDGLKAQGHLVRDMTDQAVEATIAVIKQQANQPMPQPLYLYQAQVQGWLGHWKFEGQADLIRVQTNSAGLLEVLVGDVKAARKDKVSHRLQVAIYVQLLRAMLGQTGLALGNFEGTVIRRNSDGSLQDPASAPTFDLDPYFVALEQLAIKPDSALDVVDQADLPDLHYYINQKCDGCLFNPICMVESTARQDIALIPFMESADKRALTEQGVRTVSQLAGLKNLPPKKRPNSSSASSEPNEATNETNNNEENSDVTAANARQLVIAPGQAATVQALAEKWPVGPKLDRLIQRAARVWHRLEPNRSDINYYTYFLDAGRSVLPDDKHYTDLLKIFLDVQTDYLEGRVYLVGARISGPQGQRTIVKITPSVPNQETEHSLLIEWVTAIFKAVYEVAADPSATPLHLYLYNRHDQNALLEALRRHLDVFAAIPAFYALLTETPALTQTAVSFVYDEVKERLNLPSTGHTLQAVATQLGFKWEDGPDLRYYRLFEQGMFDYLWRQEDGRWIESAVRFYSTIPLEYTYAAWGQFHLHDFKPQRRKDVWPYVQVNLEHIQKFQAKRLEALAHIENSFRFKNANIVKESLDLLALGTQALALPPFRQVLEEFLYIEHYANLQEHLQLFSQPVVRRVQQGRTLLLRCIAVESHPDRQGRPTTFAKFEASFAGTNMEAGAALQLNKIKSGDFVVLNRLEADERAWDIVRGRISVVESMEGVNIKLKLTDITAGRSNKQATARKLLPFRYFHDNRWQPQPGELYMLDEMVDELNGDKLLEACQQAEFNSVYHLLTKPVATDQSEGEGSLQITERQRPDLAALDTKAAAFGAYIAQLEGQNAPTERQQEVISRRLAERLFLVQGPPGTGKSHTLGWAVLARMFAERAAVNGKLRVAISCQTHNAVNIVLQSIASKLARLQRTKTEFAARLEGVQLYKIGEDESEANAALGVSPLDPWQHRAQLDYILNSQLVVIGATPGGLYKLIKQKTGKAATPEAMWQTKFFDLVILDEASQMNLPQALLASAWLREDGQLIVVGDHRQMAPILAHGWDTEDRLNTIATHPYRSVFQYLVDQKFPRVALDESFRLHRVQAAFLQANIYSHDGINFHSRREQLLPSLDLAQLSPYLQAVMHPDYPIVVILHHEHASQQANPTEADLLSPIIQTCVDLLHLDGKEGIGVVVPHRAQKALLRERFPALAASDAVDTVERFQGDEREVIIVSATASDPDYVLAEAEFLLNPNRLNVALSRPRQKLIVVASATVFKFLAADLEIFDKATLWKRLLAQCAREPLWQGPYADTTVQVFGSQA
jgi:hypothetical protein